MHLNDLAARPGKPRAKSRATTEGTKTVKGTQLPKSSLSIPLMSASTPLEFTPFLTRRITRAPGFREE